MDFLETADDEEKHLIARMTITPGTTGAVSIHLIGGLYVVPGANSGIEPFTVYSTSSYGSRTGNIQRYDCIQIAYAINHDEKHLNHIYDVEDEVPFCQVHTLMFFILTLMYPYVLLSHQVLAILRVTDLTHIDEEGHTVQLDKFYLVVTDLLISEKTATDNFLPYPLLKYDIGYDPVQKINTARMHIIDAESIFRPAILIPCNERKSNFGHKFKLASKGNKFDSTSAVRMWGIPYKILDRAGYDMNFPSNADDDNNIFLNDDNMHIIFEQARQIGEDVDEGLSDDNDDRIDDNSDHSIM